MFSRIAIAAAAGFGLLGAAQANVSSSTVGNVTTLSENFNLGTSFTPSTGWSNVVGSTDDYLWLSIAAPSASYTFSAASAISSMTLSFWFSGGSASNNGTVSLAGSTFTLGDTPGTLAQFVTNNPGPAVGGFLNADNWDQQFSYTWTNLAAGPHTLKFTKASGPVDMLKVDDVKIEFTTVPSPVPEPSALVLALGALGVLAAAGRRRPGR